MTVKELTAAQRAESEEEDKALSEIEKVKGTESARPAPDDEMFCTAAGAVNVRPSGKSRGFLRSLFAEVDRA